jgi:hypothetical protein
VKKALKTFEYYEAYKEQIDFILNPQKVLKEKERVDYDIAIGWGLISGNNPTKRELMSERQLRSRAERVDLDSLSSLISVQFNQDEYVDTFVRAIKHRIIAMNWKLKNNYFLFGLRKGVKAPIAMNKAGEYLFGHEQIETTGDRTVMSDTFTKMISRFRTGETRGASVEQARKQIIIGLPYDLRLSQNTRVIVDLVHSIENGKFKPTLINAARLKDEQSGEIWECYNRRPQDSTIEPVEAHPGVSAIVREIQEEDRIAAEEAEPDYDNDEQYDTSEAIDAAENENEELDLDHDNGAPFKTETFNKTLTANNGWPKGYNRAWEDYRDALIKICAEL